MAQPLKVCITGAAGQIAYSLLYSLAKGDVYGENQPLILTLLDITPMMGAVDGVVMELQDCALTLLQDVIATDDPNVAFKDIDVAILVGAMPRREGMERKDLLKANARIFETQGRALDQNAKKTVKVLVVGNPANTNAVLCLKSAPSIPSANFSCLTRLDFNRAKAAIAQRCNVTADKVKNVTIWGNHSSTQFPDVSSATVVQDGKERSVYDAVGNDTWLKGEFIQTIQGRGAAVIKARKLSSAMSAAKAICDHLKDWYFGTPKGESVSMGLLSDGSLYDIPEGIVYSFPVTIQPSGEVCVVQGRDISDFARGKMDITAKELVDERDTATQFLSGEGKL